VLGSNNEICLDDLVSNGRTGAHVYLVVNYNDTRYHVDGAANLQAGGILHVRSKVIYRLQD